jgi:hypothetical protein
LLGLLGWIALRRLVAALVRTALGGIVTTPTTAVIPIIIAHRVTPFKAG